MNDTVMNTNINQALAFLAGAAMIGFATGCASTKTTTQATVCPECKTVIEQVSTGRPEYDLYETREERRHSCPGCQGALVTFYKEGKFQHKCSICSQGAFTCPVVHPTVAEASK